MMTTLWEGIMADKHNSEQPMIFMTVILKKCKTVTRAKDVRVRLRNCL